MGKSHSLPTTQHKLPSPAIMEPLDKQSSLYIRSIPRFGTESQLLTLIRIWEQNSRGWSLLIKTFHLQPLPNGTASHSLTEHPLVQSKPWQPHPSHDPHCGEHNPLKYSELYWKDSTQFHARFLKHCKSECFSPAQLCLPGITWVCHVNGSADMSYTQMNLPFASDVFAISSWSQAIHSQSVQQVCSAKIKILSPSLLHYSWCPQPWGQLPAGAEDDRTAGSSCSTSVALCRMMAECFSFKSLMILSKQRQALLTAVSSLRYTISWKSWGSPILIYSNLMTISYWKFELTF